MTAPEETALGVGRWDNTWPHHFGHGLRLMLESPEQRKESLAAIAPAAPGFLPQQPNNARLPPVQVMRTESEITIIDPRNPSNRVTVPGPVTADKKKP